MCSFFEAALSARSLEKAYRLQNAPSSILEKKTCRPSEMALVIGPDRQVGVLKWGFHFAWSKQPVINVRSETFLKKDSFRKVANNRCLVPVSAWFEWREDKGNKLKNRIFASSSELFVMAALYDGDRFCVMTRPAIDPLSHIHHRMPIILPHDYHDLWLDPRHSSADFPALSAITPDFSFGTEEEKPRQLDFF